MERNARTHSARLPYRYLPSFWFWNERIKPIPPHLCALDTNGKQQHGSGIAVVGH